MQRKAHPLLTAVALCAALGFSASITTSCGNSEKSGESGASDVAATVNGKNITVAQIDKLIDQQMKQAGPNAPALTPVSLAAARLQLLDQLISEEALFQRAQKEQAVPTDDEVNQQIVAKKQQSGLTEDQYKKFLEQTGQTDEELKEQVKRQLAITKLRDKIGAKVSSPTDAEVRKYFDENKAQLVAPRGVELADIIVDPRDNGRSDDAKSPEEAAAKAQRLAGAIKAGTDFATLAQSQSEDPTSAMQGGIIGFFPEGELQQTFGPDIAAKFFSMQPGQVAEPIKGGDQRWHIFMLKNKREQQQELTYEQAQPQITQQLTEQRKQIVLSAMMIDVVNSASVSNNLAKQILDNPDTFGALRPSKLTEPKPAAATPAPAAPAAPAPTNAAPASSNAAPAAKAPADAKAANANAKK